MTFKRFVTFHADDSMMSRVHDDNFEEIGYNFSDPHPDWRHRSVRTDGPPTTDVGLGDIIEPFGLMDDEQMIGHRSPLLAASHRGWPL